VRVLVRHVCPVGSSSEGPRVWVLVIQISPVCPSDEGSRVRVLVRHVAMESSFAWIG
jgi:hypothetical protein